MMLSTPGNWSKVLQITYARRPHNEKKKYGQPFQTRIAKLLCSREKCLYVDKGTGDFEQRKIWYKKLCKKSRMEYKPQILVQQTAQSKRGPGQYYQEKLPRCCHQWAQKKWPQHYKALLELTSLYSEQNKITGEEVINNDIEVTVRRTKNNSTSGLNSV